MEQAYQSQNQNHSTENENKVIFITKDGDSETLNIEWQIHSNLLKFPDETESFERIKLQKFYHGNNVGRASIWRCSIRGKEKYLNFSLGVRETKHDVHANLSLKVEDENNKVIYEDADFRAVFPLSEKRSSVTWDQIIPINALNKYSQNLTFCLKFTIFGDPKTIEVGDRDQENPAKRRKLDKEELGPKSYRKQPSL